MEKQQVNVLLTSYSIHPPIHPYELKVSTDYGWFIGSSIHSHTHTDTQN